MHRYEIVTLDHEVGDLGSFFISGAPALLYQVIWQHHLTRTRVLSRVYSYSTVTDDNMIIEWGSK